MHVTPAAKRRQFRDWLESDGTMVIPGAFNALSAKLVARHGFAATYVSGSATASGAFGLPDIGLVNVTEASQEAGRIAQAVDIPTIADADTGFGDLINIPRTVALFESAGLAGIHLEDQEFPKRCGHLDGKTVISRDTMVRKITTAVSSREDSNFLIIARCDAAAVTDFADMLDRCRAYADAGADMIFPEALTSLPAFEQTAGALSVPVLANMTEFGKTPYFTAKELHTAGCRAVLFPLSILRYALGAVDRALSVLRETGTQESLTAQMYDRRQMSELTDYAAYEHLLDGLSPEESA